MLKLINFFFYVIFPPLAGYFGLLFKKKWYVSLATPKLREGEHFKSPCKLKIIVINFLLKAISITTIIVRIVLEIKAKTNREDFLHYQKLVWKKLSGVIAIFFCHNYNQLLNNFGNFFPSLSYFNTNY